MDKLCSCCNAPVDSENAPILALGGFGNAKYLCEICDNDMNIATRGRDTEQIDAAMERLAKRMSDASVDDDFVLKTVREVMHEARVRRDAIKEGSFDFEAEYMADGEVEEIPEELRETEEDRLADEREAEKAKKYDKIIGAISIVVFTLVFGCIAYRFLGTYFFNKP